MGIKLEVGKEYRTANGKLVQINHLNKEHYANCSKYNEHVYVGSMVGTHGQFFYTENGAYDTIISDYDIVSEHPHSSCPNMTVAEQMQSILAKATEIVSHEDELLTHLTNTYQEIQKSLEDYLDDYVAVGINSIDFELCMPEIKVAACQHSYKTYDSGWTKYEYCEFCQEKKI